MNKTRIIEPEGFAAANFHPCRLRESLDSFVPGVHTLCSTEVQAYLDFYGLGSSTSIANYNIGIEVVDDVELVVQHFGRAHSRGTAILLHGYTDHAGLFRHLIDHLLQQHWDVLIFDLQGHGLSGGKRLEIDCFDTYARQLAAILKHHRLRLAGPWVAVGQSTGAAIVLKAMMGQHLKHLPVVDHILLSPLIRPYHYHRVERSYRWLHWCIRRVHREPTESSNDPQFNYFVRHEDPMQEHFVDVGWVGAMLDWVEDAERQPSLREPALIIQGTDDRTLEWEHNLEVLSGLLPNANIERLTAARHHLVNEAEPWRKEVFDRISDRLKKVQARASLPRVAGLDH